VVAVAACVILTGIVWLMPRDSSDTFMALAGGQDLMRGRLGAPDDWAFTTPGRVWINQNWGSDFLFYNSWRAAGGSGLVALKAVLLIVLALALAGAGRLRGVSRPGAILLAGAVVIAARIYLDLRPNLVGLVMLSLTLLSLHLARRSVRWIWLSVACTTLWANLHGSFVLGLGMIALWATCSIAAGLLGPGGREPRRPESMRAAAHLAGAAVASILLAGTATPFGFTNVIHFFVVGGEPIWRKVAEWWPIFKTGAVNVGTKWEFLVFLGLLGASLLWNSWRAGAGSASRARSGARRRRDPARLAAIAFDWILSAIVIFMAFRARRFIPTVMIVTAPIFMEQIESALAFRRRDWALPAAALVLVAATLPFGATIVKHYRPGTAPYTNQTFFERMVKIELFPTRLCEFVDRNRIGGRVFNEWRWESFLRWRAPRLKLFIGGRAQAVYAPETYQAYLDVLYGQRPLSWIARDDIHLVVGPTSGIFGGLVDRLLAGDDRRWACVYCDENAALLADTGTPETAALVKGSDALSYPTEAIAAASRAMRLASPALAADPADAISALKAAALVYPTALLYQSVLHWSRSAGADPYELVRYFEQERERLAALPETPATLYQVLFSRLALTDMLAQLYGSSSLPEDVRRAAECRGERDALQRRADRLTSVGSK
jgi:hypothetical protein